MWILIVSLPTLYFIALLSFSHPYSFSSFLKLFFCFMKVLSSGILLKVWKYVYIFVLIPEITNVQVLLFYHAITWWHIPLILAHFLSMGPTVFFGAWLSGTYHQLEHIVFPWLYLLIAWICCFLSLDWHLYGQWTYTSSGLVCCAYEREAPLMAALGYMGYVWLEALKSIKNCTLQ